jgi:RES domain-containing protein
MIVYRISNSLYSDDISGGGAKLNGSRWNSAGTPMLYTAEHISLAILEMLVNTNFKDYDIALDLMYIHLPVQETATEIKLNKLKKNWKEDFDFTKFIGDEFVKQKQSLLLKVPSVIVHEEYNYLANPLHADFKKIKIVKTKSFWPDKRLFSI